MVKTEASHAFNIGSNPVRVTKSSCKDRLRHILIDRARKLCYNPKALRPKGFDIKVVKSHPHRVGIDCSEGPPVPIPNTEVKLICADNTWRATAREDR